MKILTNSQGKPLMNQQGRVYEAPVIPVEAEENDVNFYDYDGFRVASFTIAEAKALTQAEYDAILPPTHEGLTFQEWNWTLEDIVAYQRKYIDIGANYVTTDEKIHLKINIFGTSIGIGFSTNSQTITIEWGDGTNDSHFYASGSDVLYTFEHTYSQIGEYVLLISNDDNSKKIPIRKTYFTLNIEPKELNCIDNVSFDEENSFNYGSVKVTLSKNMKMHPQRFFQIITCPVFAIPRNEYIDFSRWYIFNNFDGKICFPASVSKKAGGALCGTYRGTRLVIPESTNDGSNARTAETSSMLMELSLPNSMSSELNLGQCSNLIELDVPQGWIPGGNITLSASVLWPVENIIALFNKLGDRTSSGTALTITFGQTNLDKLTADQKAIATNKGYTLA